ncbi:MAG: glycosyltransferase family 2 protein [Acidobacteriota bacterium]
MGEPPLETPSDPESGTAVLIPARDCGDTIGELVRSLVDVGLTVTVVDDGSSDHTGREAAAAGARVLSRPSPAGKGAALREGLAHLLQDPGLEWILLMDGDGQHLPAEAGRLLRARAPGIDLILGNRMGQSERFPPLRLWANRLGTALVALLTGEPILDSQCGFRALRSDLARSIRIESDGFGVDAEILLKALGAKARWTHVPVSAVYQGGGSHFRALADTLVVLRAILRHG